MKKVAALLPSSLNALVLLLALAACSTSRQFEHRHVIRYFEAAEERTSEVSDFLRVRRRDERSLDFHLEIVGTNYHSCEMEGVATRAGASYEFRERKGENEDEAGCVLRITPTSLGYTVHDVESRCRATWCGVRASIGTISFQRR